MASESLGRNASEPIGGPDTKYLRRTSFLCLGEGSTDWRILTDASIRSGGVVGAAR